MEYFYCNACKQTFLDPKIIGEAESEAMVCIHCHSDNFTLIEDEDVEQEEE